MISQEPKEIAATQVSGPVGGACNFIRYPDEGVTYRSQAGNYTNERDDGRLQVIAARCFAGLQTYVDALPQYEFQQIEFLQTADRSMADQFVSMTFAKKQKA